MELEVQNKHSFVGNGFFMDNCHKLIHDFDISDRHKLRMEQEDMSCIHYGLQNHQGRVESINDHVRPDMTPSLSHSADRQENRSYWIRDRHAFYDRSAKVRHPDPMSL